ncbi:hypothetical protein SDJN03_27987, partial [Cucurbita argyrosperma subsp. sororia]
MKLAVVKGKKNHEGATERAMQSEAKYWVVSVCKQGLAVTSEEYVTSIIKVIKSVGEMVIMSKISCNSAVCSEKEKANPITSQLFLTSPRYQKRPISGTFRTKANHFV